MYPYPSSVNCLNSKQNRRKQNGSLASVHQSVPCGSFAASNINFCRLPTHSSLSSRVPFTPHILAPCISTASKSSSSTTCCPLLKSNKLFAKSDPCGCK